MWSEQRAGHSTSRSAHIRQIQVIFPPYANKELRFPPKTVYFKSAASINTIKWILSKFSVLIMLVLVSTALGLPALPLTDGTNCLENADEGVKKLVLQGPFEMLKL